jgi:hypothetical protein
LTARLYLGEVEWWWGFVLWEGIEVIFEIHIEFSFG